MVRIHGVLATINLIVDFPGFYTAIFFEQLAVRRKMLHLDFIFNNINRVITARIIKAISPYVILFKYVFCIIPIVLINVGAA